MPTVASMAERSTNKSGSAPARRTMALSSSQAPVNGDPSDRDVVW